MEFRKRIDAHIHYALPLEPETLIDLMDKTGTEMANLVLVPHRKRLTAVPDALMAKAKYPDRFYVFTSFDVSEYYRHGKEVGKYMADFIENMRKCGCDGLKIIEGKPSMRKFMAIPDFDLPCWEPLWEYAEKTQLPILWHVNDPETYWDPARVPAYAKAAGELYDDSFINNEVQYAQVERILQKHPNIKIIFAHFYFMSAQLLRLAKLLDTYPNIIVDLTPGREIYENLSVDTEASKAFFEKYQDRIIYGTDIGARCVLADGQKPFSEEESLARIELIDGLLTAGTDRIMKSDGRYLVNTHDFPLRGIPLSEEILEKIYRKNFLQYVGAPAPVNPKKVIKECRRICLMLKIMSFIDKNLQADNSCAKNAQAFFSKLGKRVIK